MSSFENIVIGSSAIQSLIATVISLWAVEVWAALWTAVTVFIAVKLYGKLKMSSQSETIL